MRNRIANIFLNSLKQAQIGLVITNEELQMELNHLTIKKLF